MSSSSASGSILRCLESESKDLDMVRRGVMGVQWSSGR